MPGIRPLVLAVVLTATSPSPAHATPFQQEVGRSSAQTGFSVTNESIRRYFESGGGSLTFGLPISNEFTLLGYATQIFQRHVLQVWEDGSVYPANLLDPEMLPITSINFATFPSHDEAVATAAPGPDAPNYGQAVLAHLTMTVPDEWEGKPVNFRATYMAAAGGGTSARAALDALEVWGFPTSEPASDPDNDAFVYQRFQRGVLHYDAGTGSTAGVLLGEAFASVLAGNPNPPDLAAQASSSRFWAQYASGRAITRRAELPDTNLSGAFADALVALPSPVDDAEAAPDASTPTVAATRSANSPTPLATPPTPLPTSTPVSETSTPIVVVITLPGSGSGTPVPTSALAPTPQATSTPTLVPTSTRTPLPPTSPPATPTIPPAPGQTIQSGDTKSGSLSAGGAADWYFYLAVSRSATIQMNATSTTLDPLLELYNPSGGLLAQDDDSGGGFNARLSRPLTQTGWYKVRAKAVGASNGGYSLALTLN